MEQVKVFYKSGRTGIISMRQATENECNKWLRDNPNIKIIDLRSSESVERFTITIRYKTPGGDGNGFGPVLIGGKLYSRKFAERGKND